MIRILIFGDTDFNDFETKTNVKHTYVNAKTT
jgi:hypothetical protein